MDVHRAWSKKALGTDGSLSEGRAGRAFESLLPQRGFAVPVTLRKMRDSIMPTVRIGRWTGLTLSRYLMAAITLLAAPACNSEPRELHHSIDITIRGAGRDISARFDFECHFTGDLGGTPQY